MRNLRNHKREQPGESGAVAIFVAITLTVLVMFTALAVDVGHLYGVKNELHNAADAGALAGAHELFDDAGNLTVDAATDEGLRVTPLNTTGQQAIDDVTVETGHWSFTTREFTPSANITQTDWQQLSFAELDIDPDFINAVRVESRRADTPSFFAGITGINQFFLRASAVAYIGFAGTLYPSELDQPIAICKESVTDPDTGEYDCNMGRMLNSGANIDTSNTGGWTNFSQPCETANASEMGALVCADGNQNEVEFGQGIGATGGVQDVTFSDFSDCWEAATNKLEPWNMTLPVVECPGNNVSNCADLVGAVNVNILWVIHQNDPHYNDVPREMNIPWDAGMDWSCDEATEGFDCWKSFVDHFSLQNVSGPPAGDEDYEEMYQKKNIFFLPDCTPHEPRGNSGGQNFGILAKIPKLVK